MRKMNDMQDDLALDARAGLPDALRVLLEAYPRDGWSRDPGFDGLVQFWLDRHGMFRSLAARLGETAEAALDGRAEPQGAGRALARFGNVFLNELHGHHMIEDRHYFPVLSRRDPRILRGFEMLERDHEAIDPLLARFAERANLALQALGGTEDFRPALDAFRDELRGTERLLLRHLEDEEDLVVPVVLAHGSAGLG